MFSPLLVYKLNQIHQNLSERTVFQKEQHFSPSGEGGMEIFQSLYYMQDKRAVSGTACQRWKQQHTGNRGSWLQMMTRS